MKTIRFVFCCALLSLTFIPLFSSAENTPNTKKVFFENLKDGDTVKSPFVVKMGVAGVAIAPAGEVKQGEGHHHLIVDSGPMEAGQIVPTDPTHLHFGKGQTETTVTLPPGKHTLTLQFADGAHKSYGKDLSSSVHVTVQ
jgi:hypothetical protein